MKKLLTLGLALCMMLSIALSGCGSTNSDSVNMDPIDTDSDASAAGDTDPNTDVDTDEGNETVTIEGPIKFAVIAPITGPAASDGVSISHGIQMAVDEINAAGGVCGAEIEIDIYDGGTTADTAVSIGTLVANDGSYTAILGPHYSSQILAIGDTLAEAGVPVVTGGTTTSVLETIENPYLVRTRTPDYIVARAGAEFLAEDIGATKVGILYSNDDFGNGAKDEAVSCFEAANIEYICEVFETNDTDVTSQLLKLQEEEVDGLFIWSMGSGFIACCRQLYEFGMNDLPTVCCPALSMDNITSQMESVWTENYYCTAHWLSNQTDEKTQTFVANYTSQYDDVPSMVTVAWYESAKWIAYCIEQAGSTDPNAILAQMQMTSGYETAYCTYEYNNRDVCTNCMIAQQDDGVLVPVKSIEQ